MGDGGLAGVEHTRQVDVQDLAPGFQGGVLDGRRPGRDARVSDDDVEPPELGHSALQGVGQGVCVADVHLRGHDAPVERLDRLRGVGELLGRAEWITEAEGGIRVGDVDGDDVGAGLGQLDRVCAPLPARRAGDECDFSGQICHDVPGLL